MEKFVIDGGVPLSGTIAPAGNKNAALPILAACVLTQDEVVVWAKSGASDDVIIDRIERSDSVFRLTAGDEMQLRRQGVSEDVICAMKETARR